jgi:hypothetical protein
VKSRTPLKEGKNVRKVSGNGQLTNMVGEGKIAETVVLFEHQVKRGAIYAGCRQLTFVVNAGGLAAFENSISWRLFWSSLK